MLGCILGLTAVAVTPGDGLGHGIGGPGAAGMSAWHWVGLVWAGNELCQRRN